MLLKQIEIESIEFLPIIAHLVSPWTLTSWKVPNSSNSWKMLISLKPSQHHQGSRKTDQIPTERVDQLLDWEYVSSHKRKSLAQMPRDHHHTKLSVLLNRLKINFAFPKYRQICFSKSILAWQNRSQCNHSQLAVAFQKLRLLLIRKNHCRIWI